jgi:hypothetical protein
LPPVFTLALPLAAYIADRQGVKKGSHMTYEPITLPAAWTAEKDLQEFADRYGQSTDYFGDQLDLVFEEYDRLERSIDRALVHFGIGGNDHLNASIDLKIFMLRKHVITRSPSRDYRERFTHDLSCALMAVWEYARLVPEYDKKAEHTWLLPLIKLADLLCDASCMLEASLACEHKHLVDRTEPADEL